MRRYQKNTFITIVSISVFIFFQTLSIGADLHKAPVNPMFVKWQTQQKTKKTSVIKKNTNINKKQLHGLIPSPLDFSHLKRNIQTQTKAVSFPTVYDLRTLNKLTPIKDQNPYGTCWAFASMATIESYLMPKEDSDYSEKQLAYAAYSGSDGFTSNPAETILDQGGNMWMVTAILARWSAPVSEADVPYGNEQLFSEKPVKKHIQQAFYLPNKGSATQDQFKPDNVKNAVTNYGAVSIGMDWNDNSNFFNENNYAYYNNSGGSANHEVNIVGWDDSFSKSNFNIVPQGDGAWIVRNSWGTNWGDKGYFYISYYDTALDDGVALVAEDTSNYDNIYQYDPLGWVSSMGAGDETAMFANIFTANNDEVLEAVSFYVPTYNVTYHIYSYTDCLPNNPKSGNVAMLPQDGIFTIPGYHTVPLVYPANLKKGQTFSVIIYIETPGYDYPIPIEIDIADYSENAKAEAGQSYISINFGTTWSDLTTHKGYEQANVCLKAFTSKISSSDCLLIDENYNLQIPCAEYGGTEYGFTLNSTNLINWTMDLSTFKTVTKQDSCLTVTDNLNFEVYCAGYLGAKYGFNLKYVNEFNWYLDVNSIHQIR